MGIQDLIFRVFVSSTFSDLVAERNALQEHVFPRLCEFCQKHGARFQAIDLRWGISNEAAFDQSTMRICRAEIARCQAVTPRPNFIVLLGDRHGWRPLPEEISAAEFEALLPHLPADLAKLAKRWYKLDENAVCLLPDGTGLDKGQYVLQPRTGEFEDYDKWYDKVEGPLGDTFRRIARALDLPEDVRLKYEASATAQEIRDGAFAHPNASEHVVAFIREICTADGRPLREALPCDAEVKDFVDLKKHEHELDGESQDQLDALKQRLQEKLGAEQIKTYTARWEGSGPSTEHVPRLCEDVYGALERLISAQIEGRGEISLDKGERFRHQEFAQRRARDFTGQAEPLAEIERYLSPTSEPTAMLVVHGASGSGKSALLAKTVADHQSRYAHHQLVFRFIGATANSTDPRSLLEGLCRELGEHYGADNTDLPLDLNKLTVVFRQRLELATAEHPLALFLDALDQLQAADRPELSWLPEKLPAHVRLMVSAIPGPVLDSLRSYLPSARLLELGPMHPEDAAELLQKWLHHAGRRLTPEEQRQALRAGFARCSLPLYLRLAFEEAQRWRSYDQPPPPSPDVDGLIERLFGHLSDQLHHEPLLVERAISYLRCSRYGLTEDEILDLLANDPEYWERFLASAHHALPVTDGQQARRLPIVIWSRLYHDLEPYLSWRSAYGTALMVFFHTRFNEVADRQFLRDDTVRLARHESMATYFRRRADPTGDARWTGDYPRGLTEMPFHQTLGQMWTELKVALTDLKFIEAKSEAGMLRHLIGDYLFAERNADSIEARIPAWREWRHFVTTQAHVIEANVKRFPQIVFQQAYNLARDGAVPRAAQKLLSGGKGPGGIWFERVNRPEHPQQRMCIYNLQGHTKSVVSIAISRDGSTAISASTDGSLRLWDISTGACMATLSGHSGGVICLQVAEDDSVLSGSWDHSIRLWNMQSGQCLQEFQGHSAPIGVLRLAGRTRFISGAFDGTVRLWDMTHEECEAELHGPTKAISDIVLVGDATLVAASEDGCIHLWDVKKLSFMNRLCPQSGALARLASVSASEVLVSCEDGTIQLWDLRSGTCLRRFQGHEGPVTGLRLLPPDRFVSWSFDSTLLVWSLATGECLSILQGHTEPVTDTAMLEDGLLLSASQDSTIRLWNADTGREVNVLRGHRSWVVALAAHASGRAISASLDETLRVWDWRAASAGLQDEDVPNSPPPSVMQARALAGLVIVVDRTTAALCTSDPSSFHLWNLETGRYSRQVPSGSELEGILWERMRTAMREGEISFYGSPISTQKWGVALNAVAEKEGDDPIGIGCFRTRKDEISGRFEYDPDSWGFYPLLCRPWAHVYEFDRTIAFDARTREAHVLVMHGHSVGKVTKEDVSEPNPYRSFLIELLDRLSELLDRLLDRLWRKVNNERRTGE